MIIGLIPAYNEEKTIARVVLDTLKYCDKVIVCDDGSSDYTGIIAERMGAIVIKHSQNMGYGAALKSLFEEAIKYNPAVVVTLDADLQHDPKYIPKLVEPVLDGKADIVIGARSPIDETPLYRRAGIKLLSKFGGLGISDVQSGFRAYKGEIVDKIIPRSSGMEASIEIIDRAVSSNLKIMEIETYIKYRGLKTSTLNPLVHGYNILTDIIHRRIYKKPISYLGIPGIIMLILGFISGLWILQRYIELRELAIGTAFITVMLILGGLFLALVSILLYVIGTVNK